VSYTVAITDTTTGETRERTYDDLGEWDEGSEYWWTDGNFGCDCNRKLEFGRADGIDYDDGPCNPYPEPNRYRIKVMVGGKVVYEDDE
jgi:hypothetical protein